MISLPDFKYDPEISYNFDIKCIGKENLDDNDTTRCHEIFKCSVEFFSNLHFPI